MNRLPRDAREFAPVVSSVRGIAVSNTAAAVDDGASEVLVGETDDALVAAIEDLKREDGNGLMVSGGVRTAQKFVRLGLVDEDLPAGASRRASGRASVCSPSASTWS